jgi:thiol-disulfide isomerase/thioredoxin
MPENSQIRRMVREFAKSIAIVSLVLNAACSKDPPEPTKEPASPAIPKESARIEWLKAPAGEDAATVVKRELERAHIDKKQVLVYVGASWCEPCKRFHDAAEAGQLDGVFPNLRLVEFDLDVDADRLARAGYVSKMIPLFAIPTENGTGSGKQIEGSVKGEAAVQNLRSRLQPLLDEASRN